MAQWTQEKSAELGGMAHVQPGRRVEGGGLISRFTLRTVALALGVEFPYAVLVPIAYLQMAGIADVADQPLESLPYGYRRLVEMQLQAVIDTLAEARKEAMAA